MKAIIFNSGLGSRLGSLTADRPKCLVRLGSGETILHRQLRLLSACGIHDFVITTGPFASQVAAEARTFEKSGCTFTFVHNERYQETNYLHSLWLARHEIQNHSVLMLHGDLVFDAAYVQEVLDAPEDSLGSINPSLPLPDKDFKARIISGEVHEVGVGIFDENCVAFQAFYKLSPKALDAWLDEVEQFEERGETGVYAENAANKAFDRMHVHAFSYEGHYVEEIDTPEDLSRVSSGIRWIDFANQPVFEVKDHGLRLVEGHAYGALCAAQNLGDLISALGMQHPLLVVDAFFSNRLTHIGDGSLASLPKFSGYAPNPTYEQILDGIALFRKDECDGVVSVGGGSSIDVATCIRLWAPLPKDSHCGPYATLSQQPLAVVPHLAIPTTAGTGSESTHFAVMYLNGRKLSIAQDSALPSVAVLDSTLLDKLPAYQRTSTFLDALCQAIESHWSVRSCTQSREYSSKAIPLLMDNAESYLSGDPNAAQATLRAANLAGKAINITTTTAPHALSYKLSSLYEIPHGYAVAHTMATCWELLLERGDQVTQRRLTEIAQLMTKRAEAQASDGIQAFRTLLDRLELPNVPRPTEEELERLVASVNAQRLANYPLTLSPDDIKSIYELSA